MDNNSNYGVLLNAKNIKLNRYYFDQMAKLIGVKLIYRAPKAGKDYTTYGEIDTMFEQPVAVWGIYEEHPNQQTMRKLGWNSELLTEAIILQVPYDLAGLQQGGLFTVPTGVDDGKGRVFQVTQMTTLSIYPASITVAAVPYYPNTFSPTAFNYSEHNFDLLEGEE